MEYCCEDPKIRVIYVQECAEGTLVTYFCGNCGHTEHILEG